MNECKRCARCKESKPRDDFPPGKRWSDGLYPYCRDCKRAVQRADHAKHREKRNAAMREQYRRNPEPYKQRSRASYQADPERWKQYVRKWQLANPERRAEVALRSGRKRYAEAPELKREYWRQRRARQHALTVVPFTQAQFEQKMAYWGNRCWMCGGERQAVDHVKPINKGGAHILCNLRPACKSCNTRKRDRWPYPPERLKRAC